MDKGVTHIVLGLGATGLSVVRYLYAQGIVPLVMDTRDTPPGIDLLAKDYPDVVLMTGTFDSRLLCHAQQIIISPGVALSTPEVVEAIDAGVEVIGDVELFARAISDRQPCVIAITGSNGKTTVTTLVAKMAEAAGINYKVGGNIGTPVLDLLTGFAELYILELSSFQLETTQCLNCIACTCLNISEDHMDRYASIDMYRQAKLSLYDQGKAAFFNRDDILTFPNINKGLYSFGLNKPSGDNWGVENGFIVKGSQPVMPINEIKLVGIHNRANVIAAMALADKAAVSYEAMIQVAREFSGVAHRCELIACVQGVTYINDSKATNVGATLAAIGGLNAEKIILIAGGDGKGADFKPLVPALKQVKHLITLGADGDKIGQLKAHYYSTVSMKNAVNKAHDLATEGDIVLLSPACASLDMYDNFMVRGEDFRQQVQALDRRYSTTYSVSTEVPHA